MNRAAVSTFHMLATGVLRYAWPSRPFSPLPAFCSFHGSAHCERRPASRQVRRRGKAPFPSLN